MLIYIFSTADPDLPILPYDFLAFLANFCIRDLTMIDFYYL